MQITTGFQKRVEVLAHRHSQDWRFSRGLTSQDYWLIAQGHVRRMGVCSKLIPADRFTELVRDRASSLYRQRTNYPGSGPSSDWDLAWLKCLDEGLHLQSAELWSQRNRKRSCAVVYFVQALEARNDLGELVYRLQFALRREKLNNLSPALFHPLSTKIDEFPRQVQCSTADYPSIFVVDAEKLRSRFDLADLLEFLRQANVPWRCDSDFITYSLRDIQYALPCSLNTSWANFAGYEDAQIAYHLLADMLAL